MEKKYRLKLRHRSGKETYSAVTFKTKENAEKFAKRNKKSFKECVISIIKTRNTDYKDITCI